MSTPVQAADHPRLLLSCGQRVRAWRLSRGMTQADLARRVGVSRVSINNIEHGRQDSPLTLWATIAWALGVDLVDLLPQAGAPRPIPTPPLTDEERRLIAAARAFEAALRRGGQR